MGKKASAIDVKSLINNRFNGRAQLHKRLRRAGFKITVKGIDKWIERNRIPGDAWPELYAICDKDGRPLDLAPYRVDKKSESILD